MQSLQVLVRPRPLLPIREILVNLEGFPFSRMLEVCVVFEVKLEVFYDDLEAFWNIFLGHTFQI